MTASLPSFCVECAPPPALMRTSRYWNQDALHVYARNTHVDDQNKLKLKELAPEQHVVIKANDNTKDKHIQMLNLKPSDNKADTGGLVSELRLAVGAKVMLTVNYAVQARGVCAL